MSDGTEISKPIPALRGIANAGIDPEAVELANAYGPYAHGTWVSQELSVGNEEALSGRGAFLVSHIRSAILERFTIEQIRGMTLVDVGCYDGWLICQLEDLPFARMIGIEPRKKNLDKGRVIRQLLGIKTRCEFRQGSIENLEEVMEGEKADIVVCAGLFHHLASTAEGVAALHAICGKFLFLETICFPVGFEDERLRRALELKDIPYFFGSRAFGVTGHKLESGYYDGSATQMSVVSLPSIDALKMFLDVGGFAAIKVEVDPETYSQAVAGGDRSFSSVCMSAAPREGAIDVTAWIENYEGGLVRTLLPLEVAETLYRMYCLGEQVEEVFGLQKLAAALISASGDELESARSALLDKVADVYLFEILKNLRYAPHDKIALEYGKCLVAKGEYEAGEKVLLRVTRRMNADWRAVYRAFCVMAWSARARGEALASKRYEELCRIANPQYPDALLNSGAGLFLVAGDSAVAAAR